MKAGRKQWVHTLFFHEEYRRLDVCGRIDEFVRGLHHISKKKKYKIFDDN